MFSTSLPPYVPIHIYMCIEAQYLETREGYDKVTFTLPAGGTMPSDIGPIIQQLGRVISYEKSNIVGRDPDGNIVCSGTACMGYSSAERRVTYSADALYPPKSSFLSDKFPRIGFVQYLSTVASSVPPALSFAPKEDYVIFRLTYNGMNFRTADMFRQLYFAIAMQQQIFFKTDSIRFYEHNLAVLRRVQRTYDIKLEGIPVISKESLRADMKKNTIRPVSTRSYRQAPKKPMGVANSMVPKEAVQNDGPPFERISVPPGQMPVPQDLSR